MKTIRILTKALTDNEGNPLPREATVLTLSVSVYKDLANELVSMQSAINLSNGSWRGYKVEVSDELQDGEFSVGVRL